MPTVHLICGPVGAGKTTVARRLAETHGALRFSLDEWVMQLFAAEAPEPMVFDWWADHCERCSKRIWQVCEQALARNVDVILDCGFPAFAHREQYRRLALATGAGVHLHVVACEPDVRRDRVRTRNTERGPTFALPVTDAMFEGSEAWWEPPKGAELTGLFTLHASERNA
jgi:predicted kinase